MRGQGDDAIRIRAVVYFDRLVRGKYAARLPASSNLVVLDPEVADLFPDAKAVNAALRSLAKIAEGARTRRRRHR